MSRFLSLFADARLGYRARYYSAVPFMRPLAPERIAYQNQSWRGHDQFFKCKYGSYNWLHKICDVLIETVVRRSMDSIVIPWTTKVVGEVKRKGQEHLSIKGTPDKHWQAEALNGWIDIDDD